MLAQEDDIYNFVISVSEGKMNIEEIIMWIKNHTTKS